MSTALPPYSGPMPLCPKCGACDASTTFRIFGTCIHNTGNDGEDYVVGTCDAPPNDRMCRSCRRCGYSWDEAPRDDPSRPGPTKEQVAAYAAAE